MSFILTIWNVNVPPKQEPEQVINRFILTIWNVNSKILTFSFSKSLCFILTIWNVNRVGQAFFADFNMVLY